MDRISKLIYLYIVVLFFILFLGAYTLGKTLAGTKNIKQSELFVNFNPALPSRILDIRGDLITEFSMDEKRELINYGDISPYLIQALLAREDSLFYSHRGFRIKSIIRAFIGKITGTSLGGGSTITQQIAGLLYCDRTDMTVKRKIQELWWALQMERRYSKDEIMILYLNEVYFGGGTNGVSAASRFYFGHSAAELTPAEAAILVIQLSNPTKYNPFDYPNRAKERQEYVLQGMVKIGYITREEALNSFEEYWADFDYTRIALSAWFTREDKARWFSEYVRRELENMMYGTMNLYKDGYTVHTTCDLRHQEIAEREFQKTLKSVNKSLASSTTASFNQAEIYGNITALLSLCFGIEKLHVGEKQLKIKTASYYRNELNSVVDIMSLICGIDNLKTLTKQSTAKTQALLSEKVVEGAFVSLETETGYITALIGGSNYNESNQLIRATQAKLQVGSSIKPLIYSAAIDQRKITAATRMDDTPQVFENAAGVQYIPNNYGGKWRGTVLVYQALSLSLNIPAIKILEMVGFDSAITRIAALTGITDPAVINKTFERVYPLALGISALTPIQMLRAFTIFGNQGRDVEPIAIRSIEDRNGSTILDPELDLRIAQRKRGSDIQIVSPQNAYIMTQILKKTISLGTLFSLSGGGSKFEYRDEKTGRVFRMPMAAKTGTTQNWSDSWAAIYSPYYAAIVWYGFDRGSFSLGTENAGAALSGRVAVNFMQEIHKGKPYKDFILPSSGIVTLEVCKKSGALPSENCSDGTVALPFLSGTQPTEICTEHTSSIRLRDLGVDRLKEAGMISGNEKIDIDKSPLMIDPSVYEDPDVSIESFGEDNSEWGFDEEKLSEFEEIIPNKSDAEEDVSEDSDNGSPKDDNTDGDSEVENPWI